MLSNIFYFTGFLLLLMNILIFSNFRKYVFVKEFSDKFKKVTGKVPEKSDYSENNFEFINFVLMVEILNFFWFFFGLIGTNWLVFLLFFVIFSVINSLTKIIKIRLLHNSLVFLKLASVVLFIGLLVFNHFHLHLNLTKFILQ